MKYVDNIFTYVLQEVTIYTVKVTASGAGAALGKLSLWLLMVEQRWTLNAGDCIAAMILYCWKQDTHLI